VGHARIVGVPGPARELRCFVIERSTGVVRVAGEVTRASAGALFQALSGAEPHDGRVELAGITRVDAVGLAAVVAAARQLAARSVALHVDAPEVAAAVQRRLDRPIPAPPQERLRPSAILALIGEHTHAGWVGALGVLATARDATVDLVRIVLRRARMPRGALATQIVAMGTDGAGIISILAFLLGMILAIQGAAQLGEFGATSLVPDVVALSLVREFASMLTAILVIGRSGAAVTAELASMTVGQEVAALRTMGISPTSFLVTPRILSFMIIMPALTLLSMFVGLLGAVVTSVVVTGMTPKLFWMHVTDQLIIGDVWYGMFKAVVFAAATGVACCAIGLRTRGGAVEVGRSTTRAVVLSLFLFVVLDSLFSMTSGATLR